MGSVSVSPNTNLGGMVPSYDYECPGEGIVVELSLPFDHEQPICIRCGAPMERVYTAPAVKFNGTGFYSTGG